VRVSRAIEDFLGQMEVERDWTKRSLDSYRRVLEVLLDELGDEVTMADLDGRPGTEKIRRIIAKRWGSTSAARRANVISVFHSFGSWAEDEALVADDPARRIKRPRRKRADVYRPSSAELELGYRATTLQERAPWLLMAGVGLRATTVCRAVWDDIDLTRGRIRVAVKGGHRDWMPLAPDVLEELRAVYTQLAPDGDDHVFVPTVELEHGNQGRRRIPFNPKTPSTQKTLWLLVRRVCERAGIRPLGPHALRHGFATRFLRDSDRDVMTLQKLLGHSKLETTRGYVRDLEIEDVEEALRRAAERRLGGPIDTVTSVADEGNDDPEGLGTPLEGNDGPGWNRTTAECQPGESAESDSASGDDKPRLADEKGVTR
jgi:integrase